MRVAFNALWLSLVLCSPQPLLSASSSATEKGSGITIELLRIRPANSFRWKCWAEAEVRLKNEGPIAQHGRILVEFPTAKESFHTAFSHPCTLPPRSHQEIKLMVRFPPSFTMPTGGLNGFPVLVRLMRDTVTLAQDTFYSVPFSDGGAVTLWCDDGDGSLGFSLKKSARESDFKGMHDLVLAPVRTEDLPHHSMGYDSIDLVVISGWNQRGLDPQQSEALLVWVRRGGKLLVIGGPYWLEHPNHSLAEALPLWPLESYQTSTLPEIEKWAGDLGIDDGISVMDGPRKAAEILFGNEDQPILLRRAFGFGFTLFLTLDVDRHHARPAAGMSKFMQKVLSLINEEPRPPPDFTESSARQVLEQLVAVKIVSRERMAAYLGLYGGLVIGMLATARFTKRPEWGYVPVAVAAVAWFFWLQQGSQKQWKTTTGQIERVRAYIAETREGSDFTRFSVAEGFFPSSPRFLNPTAAGLAAFDSVSYPLSGFGAERAETVEIQTRDSLSIAGWQLRPNTLRSVTMDGFLNSTNKTARFSARLTRDGLVFDVQSRFPWKLEKPFVKWNRFITPLRDIGIGQEARIETWKQPADWGRYQSSMIQGASATAQNLLRQTVLPDALRKWPAQGDIQRTLQRIHGKTSRKIVFGGFTREDPRFWNRNDDERNEAVVGLWMVLGSEALLTADPEFSMPPGIAELVLEGKEGKSSYLGDGNFGGTHEDLIPVNFLLPACLKESEVNEMTLHADFESLYFEPQVQIGFGSTTREPSQWKTLPWSPEASVQGLPFNFTDDIDRIWVRIRIHRRARVQAASQEGTASLTQGWYLRDLDLSLHGKKLTSKN